MTRLPVSVPYRPGPREAVEKAFKALLVLKGVQVRTRISIRGLDHDDGAVPVLHGGSGPACARSDRRHETRRT